MKNENRRTFIKQASFFAGFSTLLPLGRHYFSQSKQLPKPEGPVILFQGDSITDAWRNKANYYPNNMQGLGSGYVFLAAAELLASQPEKKYHVYNRGISGNKVYQLANRWQDDCLNLQPNVLSILIGVNDFWHTLGGRYDGTVETYDSDLRKLLERTKKALPNVKLIMGEPFAVEGGSAINEKWGANFDAYRVAAQKIAKDFQAEFIPYHTIFANALNIAPVDYWCPDGVHPSLAGAKLMAKHWLEAFEKI